VSIGLHNNWVPLTEKTGRGAGVTTIWSESGEPIHFSSLLQCCRTLVSISMWICCLINGASAYSLSA